MGNSIIVALLLTSVVGNVQKSENTIARLSRSQRARDARPAPWGMSGGLLAHIDEGDTLYIDTFSNCGVAHVPAPVFWNVMCRSRGHDVNNGWIVFDFPINVIYNSSQDIFKIGIIGKTDSNW